MDAAIAPSTETSNIFILFAVVVDDGFVVCVLKIFQATVLSREHTTLSGARERLTGASTL